MGLFGVAVGQGGVGCCFGSLFMGLGLLRFVESRVMEMNVRRSAYPSVRAVPPTRSACVFSRKGLVRFPVLAARSRVLVLDPYRLNLVLGLEY